MDFIGFLHIGAIHTICRRGYVYKWPLQRTHHDPSRKCPITQMGTTSRTYTNPATQWISLKIKESRGLYRRVNGHIFTPCKFVWAHMILKADPSGTNSALPVRSTKEGLRVPLLGRPWLKTWRRSTWAAKGTAPTNPPRTAQ